MEKRAPDDCCKYSRCQTEKKTELPSRLLTVNGPPTNLSLENAAVDIQIPKSPGTAEQGRGQQAAALPKLCNEVRLTFWLR